MSLYVEPWRLVTYASGLIFGKVYFPGPGYESEFPVYAGLAAAGLAVVGAIRFRSETRVRIVAIAGAASLAIAFVYPLAWLCLKVPLLNLSPTSRCLFITGFSIAYLAAHGMEALAIDLGRAPRGAAWITIAFALATLLGRGPLKTSNGAAIETSLGFALATGAAFAAYRWKRPAAALGFAAILFELLPPFMQFNAHSDSSLLSQVPERVRRMKELEGPWRGTGLLGTSATSSRSEQWSHDLVAGNNLLAHYGVENVGGFEAILPRHYVTFADAAGDRVSPAGRTLQFTRFGSPLLDFVGLKHVLLPAAIQMPSRFRKLEDFDTVSLFENRTALPRARLMSEIRIAKDAGEAERLLRDPAFDPRREAIIESDQPLAASAAGEVIWKERSTDRAVLGVESKQDGVLVVADTDYPGWEAAIDGKPARIYRANLAFRAVTVPAGLHTVEFRFRPSSARHGMIASAFFLVLSIGAGFYRSKP
jgi:hypothetical protein